MSLFDTLVVHFSFWGMSLYHVYVSNFFNVFMIPMPSMGPNVEILSGISHVIEFGSRWRDGDQLHYLISSGALIMF